MPCPNPHCHACKTILTSYAYNNGSAQWQERRCELCGCIFKVNRTHTATEVIRIGRTPREICAEILRIAALQASFNDLVDRNAPDEWFTYMAAFYPAPSNSST